MPVATIYQNQNTSKVPYKLLYFLIFIGLLAAIYFGVGFARTYLELGGSSSLSADVFFGEGGVYLDNALLGPFPYVGEDVEPGEHKVTFKGNGVEYNVNLNFLPGSEVVLKRDLGVSQVFSAGQNFWLEKNDSDVVLSVISEPNGADVYIDGSKVGNTPYSSSSLTPGDYDLRVEMPGYEAQTARIEVNEAHKLNSSFSLFPVPVPQNVSLLEGSQNLYDVASDNAVVTSDPTNWVAAVVYWNETRGINLSNVGVNKELVFDYFLDYAGNVYTANGTKVAVEGADFVSTAERGAYLRRIQDGAGLSPAAKETFLALGQTAVGGKKATVLETGLGWLRVRDVPGLDGTELTRVNVGDSFDVLEEQDGWVKIKVSSEVEGWVSEDYVDIEEPAAPATTTTTTTTTPTL